MPNDKEKLLKVMRSLDADYAHGKISEEKYRYFRSKYEDKLNTLDARDATNRIRSMQGKSSGKRKTNPKPPKLNKKKKEEPVLVLVIGFTAGIGYGVLTFDFGNISVTDAQAIVEDTAFPEVEEVKVNDTDNDSVQVGDTYTSDNSYDSGDSSSGQGSGSYDSGTGGSSGSGDSGTVEGTVTG